MARVIKLMDCHSWWSAGQ